MSGRYADRAIDLSVALTVNGAEPIRGRFTAIKLFEAAEGGFWPVFNVEVELQMFWRVEDENIFGFSATTIAPNQNAVELHSALPVDLELTLGPQLLAALHTPFNALSRLIHPSLEAVLDRLVRGLQGEEPALPLTHVAAYRWLRVLQTQPSGPSGMTIKQGYRSVFAR